MSYAKPCKFCKKIQVVWDEKLEGSNKYKEVENNQPHTRDRCEAAKTGGLGQYNKQEEKEFVEGRGYMEKPQKKEVGAWPQAKLEANDIMVKLDNLNIAIAKVMSTQQRHDEKLDNLLFLAKNLNEQNSPTERDNMILRQQVTELEEALKKQGNLFVPANQVKMDPRTDTEEGPDSFAIRPGDAEPEEWDHDHDQHVRDMVEKGKKAEEDDEELEL